MNSILLATEGTYPFHGGGVSTWCNVLTTRLAEYRFSILAVIMHPYLQARYVPPPNVTEILKVPLWGTEDPIEQRRGAPFSEILKRRQATTEPMIRRWFIPVFEELLEALKAAADGRRTGRIFAEMAACFRQFDMFVSFRSPIVWESFRGFCEQFGADDPSLPPPTVRDAAECLQLLARLLQPLDVALPAVALTHSAAAAVCGLPCVVAKIEQGTPYLLTEHGVYLREQYLNVTRTARTPFVKIFLLNLLGAVVRANYAYADVVSPVCRYNARWEQAQGVEPQRIEVIYNGADAERFRPLGLPRRTRPTVTQVGLIFALKGTRDLIAAAARVREQVPEVEFLLYGSASDPDYFAECKKLVCDLKLEETVTFAGLTAEPEKVFNEADVVTLSSISEGFPYTVVEAMLCGSSIVATEVGGVGEALAETGILVPPRQPEALAAAIVRLLNNQPLRTSLGKQARERAVQYFTEVEFAAQYRALYAKLMKEPGSGFQAAGFGFPRR